MITFDSQVDFERAVMQVLHERLTADVSVNKVPGGFESFNHGTAVRVTLNDEYGGAICSDRDQT